MARTWMAIKVELVGGGGEQLWPRPGRVIVASRRHTFAMLADSIDGAFARWDRSHLHMFDLAGGRVIVSPYFEDPDEGMEYSDRLTLGRLKPGEQFAYTFDLGDSWEHLCTVDLKRVDPADVYGSEPSAPVAVWGWGSIPDQYGRRTEEDDGTHRLPRNPGYADLPPVLPHWGPRDRS
jgi:hypothetical protein